MKRLLTVSIALTMLWCGSCDNVSDNVVPPASVLDATAAFKNVPWQLVSATMDTGVINLSTKGPFELLLQDGQFMGKASCNTYWAKYRIIGDSVVIESASSQLAGCYPWTPVDPCDLLGPWKFSMYTNTLILSGRRATLEFFSPYGHPVKNLPLVSRNWELVASNHSTFSPMASWGVLARLEMRPDRTYNLWWNYGCDWSATDQKGFGGYFGVDGGSGIVLRQYWSGGYCSGSNTPADSEIWPFTRAFRECASYAATDTSLVLTDTRTGTFFRFAPAH